MATYMTEQELVRILNLKDIDEVALQELNESLDEVMASWWHVEMMCHRYEDWKNEQDGRE